MPSVGNGSTDPCRVPVGFRRALLTGPSPALSASVPMTGPYVSRVSLAVECPSHEDTVLLSTAAIQRLAAVWRRSWGRRPRPVVVQWTAPRQFCARR